MSFRVNTNVASLQSQEYLRQTQESQGKTINRVTSGLRIIASGDDAAGLAIANGFRSDQAVLSQGVRNANDGLSTLQTLDGGINNIGKLLDRARTLATQSASGTFTGDRGVLDTEFSSVIGEIDRQAQAVGLTTGGAFARSLSVFIGGGRSANGISTTTNGSVGVDLSTSTVDSKSLGLKGVQAQGVSSVDIGTGSASTSVQAVVSDATNVASLAVGGSTDFFFKGPGFSDGEQIKVSVNLSGVTNVDNLATNINAAIDSAGAASSQQATAFKNAGVRATVVTDSTGKKSLGFSSASTAFQVAAGDRLSNALLGNVTSGSNPTGVSLTNTVTGGSATAAAASTFGATGAGTVKVRLQGANLTSPVDLSLTVAAGTTIEQALTSLTSAVSSNAALQAAGISVSTATAGSALVFSNARGEKFEVSSSGDVGNVLGLGSFQSSAGTSGNFDYKTIVGNTSGTFAAGSETLEFSVGGGQTRSLAVTVTAATAAGAAEALNAKIASDSVLSAAGLVASVGGGAITITSTNDSKFRLNSVGATNIFGFNDRGGAQATGLADVAETQSAGTAINHFSAGGAQQTSLLTFSAINSGADDQTVTITANNSAGVSQSLGVVLRNDNTVRNAGTVDEAIDAINTALQQSNNDTLKQVVAVKDKASAGGAEGIRFISNLASFKVGVGTNAGGTGIGSQGTVVTASTVGTGSTASINSQASAEKAVTALGEAIATLGTAQAVVGRGQNQFTYAVNLAQSQLTNLAASESRIRDADLAEEAANLTKAQILLQAGISALSQANSAPQQVLSLLRG
ncbi:MAG: flagellin [Acidobacteria bacterium]|nr:flagellin [Acidobacteriota bacterium]